MVTSSSVLMRRFISKAKFRHMEALIRVAELGSMRKAATSMSMAQPTVTQLIAELESLLEVHLFLRHSRGVEPTDIALELLPIARRIIVAVREGAETVTSRVGTATGLIRVAASEAGLLGVLLPLLPDFAERHPDIHIEITGSQGSDPLAPLISGACDVLFTREPETVPSGWEFLSCATDRLIVVCGPSHAFSGPQQVSAQQLGGQSWLTNRADSIARQRLDEMTADFSWQGDNSSRCNVVAHIPEVTVHMLAGGRHLALLPETVAQPYIAKGEMVAVQCDISYPLRPVGMVWNADQAGLAVQRLVRTLAQ